MKDFTTLAIRYLAKLGYKKSGETEYSNGVYRALIKPDIEEISINAVSLTFKGEYCSGHIAESNNYQCNVTLNAIKKYLKIKGV